MMAQHDDEDDEKCRRRPCPGATIDLSRSSFEIGEGSKDQGARGHHSDHRISGSSERGGPTKKARRDRKGVTKYGGSVWVKRKRERKQKTRLSVGCGVTSRHQCLSVQAGVCSRVTPRSECGAGKAAVEEGRTLTAEARLPGSSKAGFGKAGRSKEYLKEVKSAVEEGRTLTAEVRHPGSSDAGNGKIRKIAGRSSSEVVREGGSLECPVFTAGCNGLSTTFEASLPQCHKASYKAALVGCFSSPTSPPLGKPSGPEGPGFPEKRSRFVVLKKGRRCFRCLARDHLVVACRDPLRCYSCGKVGHRASRCPSSASGALRNSSAAPSHAGGMDRIIRRRGRGRSLKAYIPYTEEFLRRVELKRNAVLADVVQPADLGPDP